MKFELSHIQKVAYSSIKACIMVEKPKAEIDAAAHEKRIELNAASIAVKSGDPNAVPYGMQARAGALLARMEYEKPFDSHPETSLL